MQPDWLLFAWPDQITRPPRRRQTTQAAKTGSSRPQNVGHHVVTAPVPSRGTESPGISPKPLRAHWLQANIFLLQVNLLLQNTSSVVSKTLLAVASFVDASVGARFGIFNSLRRSHRDALDIEETSTERAGRKPKLPTESDLRVTSLVDLHVELLGNIYDHLHEPKDWLALRCSNSVLASSMPPKLRDILLTRICNDSLSVYFSYDRSFRFDAAIFAPLWLTKKAIVVDSRWPDRALSRQNGELGLPDMPELQKLETLELIGNEKINSFRLYFDPKLPYLLFDKTPKLQSLKIKHYVIANDQMLSILRKIPKLRHLDIHQNWVICDLNMILGGARELQSLSIRSTIDDGNLYVSSMSENNRTLKSLTCSFQLAQQVNVDELYDLQYLEKLQNLIINKDLGSHIVCLQHLRNNKELRSLTLPVSRSSFNAGVPSLPQLNFLNLQDKPNIPEEEEEEEDDLTVSSPNWLRGFTNLNELRIPELFKANKDVLSCVASFGFRWHDERAAFIR